ncbi:MAG: ion channel [Acidimicrobiia bacterium]
MTATPNGPDGAGAVTSAGPRPTRIEEWLERRFPPYGFGVVFLLLLATYVVMATSPPHAWARVVTVCLEGVTLLVTLVAARSGRILFRIASVVVGFAIVTACTSLVVNTSPDATGWFFVLNVLLVAAAPVAIATSLYRRDVVDIRTVMGAICIYLLIGTMYAFLYASIGLIGSEPFFVQDSSARLPIYLYFSYVTQTTVGFGDYTAATDLGRALAASEALLGQLYLVTVIAVLVSRMAPVGRRHRD